MVEEPDYVVVRSPVRNETLLRDLFATPPPDFVAARNEVVKALRKDKARDDATVVAALRPPGWDDWSLNTVATSDPDVVAGFIDAAAQVRDVQAAAIEGRDGPDIRTALRDLRDRSADLVRLADTALAGAGRQAVAGEINARLSQVAASDVAGAQLIAGILGSGHAAPNEAVRRPAAGAVAAQGDQGREADEADEADRSREVAEDGADGGGDRDRRTTSRRKAQAVCGRGAGPPAPRRHAARKPSSRPTACTRRR